MKERFIPMEAKGQGNKPKPPTKREGTQWKWREEKAKPKKINERKK
ncbi:MAG TPA: hypothetical protein VD999_05675 [Vitreimonas sp.]|nr:hypothetical protein [Vitreimonas sp.]